MVNIPAWAASGQESAFQPARNADNLSNQHIFNKGRRITKWRQNNMAATVACELGIDHADFPDLATPKAPPLTHVGPTSETSGSTRHHPSNSRAMNWSTSIAANSGSAPRLFRKEGIASLMSQSLRSSARRSLKHLMIRLGLEAVALSGAGRLATRAAGRGVIFTLHHVRPERQFAFEPNGHLSVTPEFLEEALLVAREAGLHPVHLHQLPTLLADPSEKRNLYCVTLDDGYRDNEQYAAPVFRRHRVPYTIFVTPGFVDRTRTLWWETAEAFVRVTNSFRFDFGSGAEVVRSGSLPEKWVAYERLAAFVEGRDENDAVVAIERAAKDHGIDGLKIVGDEIMTAEELRRLSASDELVALGAHTMTHPNLARIGVERLQYELRQSALEVAAYCGRAPKTFAYPYGGPRAVGHRESRAAHDNGYCVAVTTQPGVLRPSSMDEPTLLPRVSLNGLYQKKRFVRALVSGLPFLLT
jgi:peptidoglycan/xylan/chitin deacetylase (PgdA/CDA1 family)